MNRIINQIKIVQQQRKKTAFRNSCKALDKIKLPKLYLENLENTNRSLFQDEYDSQFTSHDRTQLNERSSSQNIKYNPKSKYFQTPIRMRNSQDVMETSYDN